MKTASQSSRTEPEWEKVDSNSRYKDYGGRKTGPTDRHIADQGLTHLNAFDVLHQQPNPMDSIGPVCTSEAHAQEAPSTQPTELASLTKSTSSIELTQVMPSQPSQQLPPLAPIFPNYGPLLIHSLAQWT